MSIRHLALALAACSALTACGQSLGVAPSARGVAGASQGARSLSPDADKVLAQDVARATYWQPDAVRVMALRATRFNTTALAATANVFYSATAADEGKPPLLVARHTGVAAVAKFYEERLYAEVGAALAPIGQVSVTADDALKTAKLALAAPGAPAGSQAPTFSTHAFLVADEQGPKWVLTAGNRQVVINGQTKAVVATAPKPKLNQFYNQDFALELQRAAHTWLPL